MNFKQLCTDVIKASVPAKAARMQEILGGECLFLGLDAAARRRVFASYLEEAEADRLDWEFVDSCWDQNIREFQYFGLAYLMHQRELIGKKDLPKLRRLIITRPNWDTANVFQKLLNYLSAREPAFGAVYLKWSRENEPWLKRVVLLHQLGRGSYTDVELLEKILDASLGAREDYVRSAVGKSLRDLREAKPDFFAAYLKKNAARMSPQSLNEAQREA